MPFDRDQMKAAASALADEGVYIGTSSWKYPGWRGQLYTDDRYIWRGRFSESRFQKLCLTEYAQVFKTVCVDAAYYNFPSHDFLEQLASQVPADFLFALKVTDAITVKHFPNLPRFGPRAGKANEDFLHADRFESEFLGPCQPFQKNIGLLIFEFSRFSRSDFEHGRDFTEALDRFLGQLPAGWHYGVEIRNRTFLHADYFSVLARHQIAHIYNSWQDMPAIGEQLAIDASRTSPEFFGARLLLRPGRKYEDAVKLFSPYTEVKDLFPEGRDAGAKLIQEARRTEKRGTHGKGFIYVNNRFEGNALETIAAIVEKATRT
jgi:uncharacterized protein YecE (DUF72 family)